MVSMRSASDTYGRWLLRPTLCLDSPRTTNDPSLERLMPSYVEHCTGKRQECSRRPNNVLDLLFLNWTSSYYVAIAKHLGNMTQQVLKR